MGLGDLFTSGGPPGMSPENQKWLRKQQLRALFAQMASASAPSRDPRSGSLGYILGQGAQGMAGATGPAMQQIMASDKFNAMRDERKRKDLQRQALKDVPRNKMVRSIGPQTPQGAYPQAEGTVPRDMGAYLRDYAMTAMKQGDMQKAATATGMIPKTTGKAEAWQQWGHGQMRNKQTGEIKKIPTRPAAGGKDPSEAWYKSARQWIKTMSEKPDDWGISQLNTEQAGKAVERLKKIKKDDPTIDSTTAANKAVRDVLGEEKEGKPKPGSIEVDMTGNTAKYQGRNFIISPDGTVMIDGRKYKVKQ